MLSRFDVNGTPGSVTINSWSASTGTISVESDLIVYTVEAYNGGPADATNLTVRDDFPTDIISMSDTSGGAYDPATGLWSIPTLANGSTATLRITATIDAGTAGTTITNTVAVTGSDQNDPNPDNNAAQATVTVGPRANRPPTPVVPDGDANLVPVDHLTDNIPLGGTPKPLHLVDPDGDAFTVNVLTG